MDTSEPRMNSDAVSSNMHAAICHNKIWLLMNLSILSQRGKKTSGILEFIYIFELKKIVSRAAAIFISIVCVY